MGTAISALRFGALLVMSSSLASIWMLTASLRLASSGIRRVRLLFEVSKRLRQRKRLERLPVRLY